MIHIGLLRDDIGCLAHLRSEGHAAGAPGANIVCAAVSALLRSVARVLESRGSIVVSGEAPTEGVLEITIERYDAGDSGYLLGVTDVLVRGLEDLAREAPGQVRLERNDWIRRSSAAEAKGKGN